MNAEPITLDHQQLLSQQIASLQLPFSEYSFANLFLFRHVHNYTVEELGIRGKTYDGHRFVMPLFDLRKKTIVSLDDDEFFYPVLQEWIPQLPQKGMEVSFREEDNDYLFKVATFQHYPGRHLDGRRNLVHQFLDLYETSCSPIQPNQEQDLLSILDYWNETVGKTIGLSDYKPCKEAITLLQRLSLFGSIVYCDKKPSGFIIGELLNKKTCIVHFAKANIEYKGIYQYLYQAFAQQLDTTVEWMNLEQDLGDEGLKKSKSAYHPSLLLKKMRVRWV
ncbi:MAG TPA: phosphatidylglycerol lysyltransferase domain-containing protein [Chlamydiales bacterium]|nr:phosphatidylglycerol lysyltransferase domain-containing protein [Chlamydiales bacterium]